MSERLTAEKLCELRNWLERKAAPPGKAMPFARVPPSDTLAFNRTLALLDAYEATQRPVEPSEDAPLDVADLPTFWDARRAALGKGPSVCAAELRKAIEAEGIGALTAVVHELAPRVAAHRSEPVCAVCKRAWNADPGTVYCGAHHGTCGMCSGPRATCKCLTSELMQPVPHRPEQAAPPAEQRWSPQPGEDALQRDGESWRRVTLRSVNAGRYWEVFRHDDWSGGYVPERDLKPLNPAPPAGDVRARVTHEQAKHALSELVTDVDGLTWESRQEHKSLTAYLENAAELERRARELCEAVSVYCCDSWEDVDNDSLAARFDAMKMRAARVAELLGTEES